MNKNGEIIIIEDDLDDQYLLEHAFEMLSYPNRRNYFKDGIEALKYLHAPETNPFIILSDIVLPKLSGFELRKKLDEDTKINAKCIPYLFFTSTTSHQMAVDIYRSCVQGFFIKPSSITELTEILKAIMEYWLRCDAPGNK